MSRFRGRVSVRGYSLYSIKTIMSMESLWKDSEAECVCVCMCVCESVCLYTNVNVIKIYLLIVII